MGTIKDGCAFAAQQKQSNQCPVKWPRCPYCRLSDNKLPELIGTVDRDAEKKAVAAVPQKEPAKNGLLTPDEAAAYLKITVGELRDLRYRSRVAFIKVGYRTMRYRQEDLDALIERYRVSAVGEPIKRIGKI